MTINKPQIIAKVAGTLESVGVRELAEPRRAGFPLSTDEVFALMNHPALNEVRDLLEVKHGSAVFNEARGGRYHALGELLAGDREEIRRVASKADHPRRNN